MSKKEWYSNRQFVESLLPDTYEVKENISGIIRCKSRSGIEDESIWELFMAEIKKHFGESFKEVFHSTCTNHVNFTVYYNPLIPIAGKPQHNA